MRLFLTQLASLVTLAMIFKIGCYDPIHRGVNLQKNLDLGFPKKMLLRASAKATTTKTPPSLHLIGERHSGTNWITRELERCFPDVRLVTGLTRWKHWFQKDGYNYRTPKAVVVVQVRNVYDWVEAMRSNPYHAPDHFDLDWQSFVTKSWTMDDPPVEDDDSLCQMNFTRNEVVPCSKDPPQLVRDRRLVRTVYEMQPDGTPYENILALRRDKMAHFRTLGSFANVTAFELVQYEDMVEQGTGSLIGQLEEALGVAAQCEPLEGRPLKRKRALDPDMVAWLNEHVDWEVEESIGYYRMEA